MNLVSGSQINLTLGSKQIFFDLSFSLEEGEKIGLIGHNGVGKSTLCKAILGQIEIDSGVLAKKKNLKVGYLPQVPTVPHGKTLYAALLDASDDPDDWQNQSLALELISRFDFESAGLDTSSPTESLSGGWKKKLALAIALMERPELLILDEPTNHLDVESIMWLEDYLMESPLTYIAITHDRAFLDRISNVIWELDPRNRSSRGILRVQGSYADYCAIKESQLQGLQSTQSRMENTLRRETEWLRRGPKARTTKQNARIERAESLKDSVDELRNLTQRRDLNLSFKTIEGTPKKLIEFKNVSLNFGERRIINDFTFTLERGQKIGLVGANGSGKTSFIKLLTKDLAPTQGSIFHADKISISYFDQARETLNPKETVLKAVCPEGDYVKYQGQFVHVRGYLERFLFGADDIVKPISKLSGGEQARLLIAKLMLRECQLLILDEPTNDLDLATLNLLEKELQNYSGALVIVSHDRYFLDQVAQFHFSFHQGEILRFADIHQWQRHVMNLKLAATNPSNTPQSSPTAQKSPPAKLSYKEKFELDNMEATIEGLESELRLIESKINDPSDNKKDLRALYLSLSDKQNQMDQLYKRWEELTLKTK